MQRADGFHILSLALACLGATFGAGAVAAALMVAAAGCTAAGIWCSRNRSRRMTQLQAHVRDLDARLVAATLEAESARVAIVELTEQVAPIVEAARSLAEPALTDEPAAPEALVRRLSHDLRTPLTSIQACSELLLEGETIDGETGRNLAGMIHAESQRLALFIDGALTSTRMDVGILPVRKNEVSLGDVAERALHGLVPFATQRQVRVTLERSGGSEVVLGDQHLLEHVLRILFCDAIHQAPSGCRVLVRTAFDQQRRVVRLEVCCDCLGISPKQPAPALDKFYGGGEKGLEHFVPTTAGVDLARRLIETVHAGTTIARRTEDAWITGFELPVAASGGNAAEPSVEVKDA